MPTLLKGSERLQAQVQFVEMVGKLIAYAYSKGYFLSLGDGYRDPRLHGAFGKRGGYGAVRSYHKLRLAVDFNLFNADGEFLQSTEDHRPLGEYWESLGGTWGGRFKRPDGNHYSLGE